MHTGRLLQSESMKPRTAPAKSRQRSSFLQPPSMLPDRQKLVPETEDTIVSAGIRSTAPTSNDNAQYEQTASLGRTFQSQVETYDPRFGQGSLPLQYYHTQMVPPQYYQQQQQQQQQLQQPQQPQQQHDVPPLQISGLGEEGYLDSLASTMAKSSKIANFVINDEKYFDLPLGYREESTRVGPWQTSRKHFDQGRGRQSSTMIVGGLNAAMRLKRDPTIRIDATGETRKESGKVLPPDVMVHPVTMQTIAVPHQRKKPFQHNVQVESGASEKTAILEPRIIELDARKVSPRSGRKAFRGRDGMFHASSGWAVDLDYRDKNPAEWITTAMSPRASYDPSVRRSRKGPLEPGYGQWNKPTKLETVGPTPPQGIRNGVKDMVDSPRLQYRRRCQEMLQATKGWNACKNVERTFCPANKKDGK